MAIAALATETKATALIALCRQRLAVGGEIRGQNLKNVIDQLESATVNDLTARTDVPPVSPIDGRNNDEFIIAGS